MMPSRDFLVRQAVLNAMAREMGRVPFTPIGQLLPQRWDWFTEAVDYTESYCSLIPLIRDEFHALTQRYSEAA